MALVVDVVAAGLVDVVALGAEVVVDPVLELEPHAVTAKSRVAAPAIGEFDPGSGRTLAACLTHASRTDCLVLAGWWISGERVSNT
jgi:hypothetical protein